MSSLPPPRSTRKAVAWARARGGRLRRWIYRLAAAGLGVAAPALLTPPETAMPGTPTGDTSPWAMGAWAAGGGIVLLSLLRSAGRSDAADVPLPEEAPMEEQADASAEAQPSPEPPSEPEAVAEAAAEAEAAVEADAAAESASEPTSEAASEAAIPPAGALADAERVPVEEKSDAMAAEPALPPLAAVMIEEITSPYQGAAASAEGLEAEQETLRIPGEVAQPDSQVWRGPTPAVALSVATRDGLDDPLLARPVSSPPRRRPGRLAQRHTVVGIDIGSYSTKIVQARCRRRGFIVVNFWVVPTPSGAFSNGGLANPSALARRLEEIVHDYRLAGRQTVAALSIQKALTRIVKFPPMSNEEIANALRWEADTYVPMPLENAAVDFLVGSGPPEPGSREMEVLVVAAARDAVDPLAGAMVEAGLRPAAVELEPLATYRALRAMRAVPRDDAGLTAVLDLGDSGTRVSVFRHDLPVVTRAVKPGGRDFTAVVARGLKLPIERAEAAKRRWGVRDGTPITPLVEGLADKMLMEIWRSIEYFMVLAKAQRLDRVFLIGGNALQPGLAERVDGFLVHRLGERFGQIPSEQGLAHLVQPGQRVRLLRHLRGAAGEFDAQLVTALGLALWKV